MGVQAVGNSWRCLCWIDSGDGAIGLFDFIRAASAWAPDDLGEIEAASAQITVYGSHYPENLERLTGRW